MEAKKDRYTWRQFDEDTKLIAAWAKKEHINSVFGIPRGGLVIAVVLSHLLDVPLVLSREDITRRTLIVDDIVDGGGTIKRLFSEIGEGFKFASIYFNTESGAQTPTFFVHKKLYWVVFPWETDETSRYDGTTL